MKEEKIFCKEVKLELMDWKKAEAEATNEIREHKLIVWLNEITLLQAKKQIKSFGGKTLEEEKAESI